MEIAPRYDGPPLIRLDGGGPDVREAFLRQQSRLQKAFEGLSDDEWLAPSRCDEWTVQDVASHLASATGFWALSIASGLAGEPTRYLAGFDPKATPAALVAAAGSPSPAETLAGLAASNDQLRTAVTNLDDDQWDVVAEGPAGHIPIRLLVHHALWDSWIHERDVMLPLGGTPDEEADEVIAGLRFVSALGPAFAVQAGSATPATLVLEATDLDRTVVVGVGDTDVFVQDGPVPAGAPEPVVVHDKAADLVEVLSARAPLAYDVPSDKRWLLSTLGEVFESIPPGQ